MMVSECVESQCREEGVMQGVEEGVMQGVAAQVHSFKEELLGGGCGDRLG